MFTLQEQNQGPIQLHIKGIEHSYMGYWTSVQLTIYITCEITQGIENTNSDWRSVKALKFGMGPLKELLFSHLLHIICNFLSEVVNCQKEIVLGIVKFKIKSLVT
jgi:hypothetical protein